MDDSDSLDRILNIAFAEGSLQPDRLHTFATTLRERARLILAEGLEALDIRIATLTPRLNGRPGFLHAFGPPRLFVFESGDETWKRPLTPFDAKHATLRRRSIT